MTGRLADMNEITATSVLDLFAKQRTDCYSCQQHLQPQVVELGRHAGSAEETGKEKPLLCNGQILSILPHESYWQTQRNFARAKGLYHTREFVGHTT